MRLKNWPLLKLAEAMVEYKLPSTITVKGRQSDNSTIYEVFVKAYDSDYIIGYSDIDDNKYSTIKLSTFTVRNIIRAIEKIKIIINNGKKQGIIKNG